jgi:hypothetical protein
LVPASSESLAKRDPGKACSLLEGRGRVGSLSGGRVNRAGGARGREADEEFDDEDEDDREDTNDKAGDVGRLDDDDCDAIDATRRLPAVDEDADSLVRAEEALKLGVSTSSSLSLSLLMSPDTSPSLLTIAGRSVLRSCSAKR